MTRWLPTALDAGIDVLQIRVKEACDREVFAVVDAALALCSPYRATCMVDDRLDVALAAGAPGVHLGAEDLPVARARAVAGPGLLIGATVRDPLSAQAAVADGASYLGTGPAFATRTKSGLPEPIGVEGVGVVCGDSEVPVIATGGVTAERPAPLLAAGVHSVAVVGAVSDAADPGAAVRALVEALAGGAGEHPIRSGARP